MSAAPWLAVLIMLAGAGGAVTPDDVQGDLAAFEESVQDYRDFVTPRCAPEIVGPYNALNSLRDAAFVRSLEGTALVAAYRKAVREHGERAASRFFHCSSPPPPPPAPGTVVEPLDPRARTIADAQRRLRKLADGMPADFDTGDALFTQMIELRDKLLAHTEE